MQIVSNARPWRYRGVLHEFLTCEGAGPAGKLPLVNRMHFDGARRRDPATFARDAAVLEQALATETDPFLKSRYTFYLAQSCRDSGDKEKALRLYLARAELGQWRDEVFVSLLEAAKLMEQLGFPEQEVIDAYLKAAKAAPHRAEALYGAARYCREKKRHEEGYGYAKSGLKIIEPGNGLFVETAVYKWRLLDEFSVHAYWVGRYRESLEACLKLLDGRPLPAGAPRAHPDQRGQRQAQARGAETRPRQGLRPKSRAAPGWSDRTETQAGGTMPTNAEFLMPVLALIAWTFVMWVWMYATRIPAMQRPASTRRKPRLRTRWRSACLRRCAGWPTTTTTCTSSRRSSTR